jgi:hypothetical protein
MMELVNGRLLKWHCSSNQQMPWRLEVERFHTLLWCIDAKSTWERRSRAPYTLDLRIVVVSSFQTRNPLCMLNLKLLHFGKIGLKPPSFIGAREGGCE